jgi:threonine aldolase
MANAEVGDDVYGDDPTVTALERATADLLGKEDAVYMPTCTMTNQVGIRSHTEPGDAVLFDQSAHVYIERGAPAAFSDVLPCLLAGARGIFTPQDVDAAIGTFPAPISLLCLENTHSVGGGSVWPLAQLKAVAAAGRNHCLALHLDGARLWHATAATGVSEAEYAAPFDSVSVCFSKALGAPVGSCLVGPKDFIAGARWLKQRVGGGFRQAGIIAAGALHALQHHRPRLGETHETARRFTEGLAQLDRILIDPATVETNIVRFRLKDIDAASFVEAAHRRGLLMLPSGANAVRAAFYLDVAPAAAEQALTVITEVLRAFPSGTRATAHESAPIHAHAESY